MIGLCAGALCALNPVAAFADWGPGGINVSQLPPPSPFGLQAWQHAITTDGHGGGIIAWAGDRNYPSGLDNGAFDIFVQRIDANGDRMWAQGGVVLTTPTSAHPASVQQYPRIVPDGAGGAIVAWVVIQRATGGQAGGVRIQRLDAAGAPQWGANGVVVYGGATQDEVQLTGDGAGGAIVAWAQYISLNTYGLRAQRLNGNGVPQWTAAICNDGFRFLNSIVADDAGGAIIAWQDADDIFAQRINAAGTPEWGVNGVGVSLAAGNQSWPVLSRDGSGGAFVTWDDQRSGPNRDIYAQRLSAAGQALWATNGVVVCNDISDQGVSGVVSDETGNAIFIWSDFRNGNDSDVYAQRMNSSGVPQWSTNGVALCSAAGDQYPFDPYYGSSVTTDGEGGAMVTWTDERSGDIDVYGQRVSADGLPQWQNDGLRIVASGYQDGPVVCSNGVGGAIVAYEHATTINDQFDIYCSIANGNTVNGINVPVTPLDATTGATPITLTFANVSSGSTSLVTTDNGPALPATVLAGNGTYYNLSTTAVFTGDVSVCVTYDESELTVPESALRLIHYDQSTWVDITTSLDTNLNTICGVTTSLSPFAIGAGSVTAVKDPLAPTFTLHQNWPNPFNPATTITFDLEDDVRVSLRIYDLAGHAVRSLVDGPSARGPHRVAWDGRDDNGRSVASGVYFCKMTAGSFQQVRRMVLIK
jgi:hypothetical protein